MWGDSLMFEQLVSVVASLREGSADTLYSDEGKLSSPIVLNKIPAFFTSVWDKSRSYLSFLRFPKNYCNFLICFTMNVMLEESDNYLYVHTRK